MIQQDLKQEIQIDEDIVLVSFAKIILQCCVGMCVNTCPAKAVEAIQKLDKQIGENASATPKVGIRNRRMFCIFIARARNSLLYRKQELEPDTQIKRKIIVRTGDYTHLF